VRPALSRTVMVNSGWEALGCLLRECARDDPEEVARFAGHRSLSAPEIHALVQRRVRFIGSEDQRWATPARTLAAGFGDCGNSSRAIMSLASYSGVPSRHRVFTRTYRDPGPLGARWTAPEHVAAELHDGRAWRWAEAAIPARFGEPSLAAASRLGIMTTLKEDPRAFVPSATATTPAPTPAARAPHVRGLVDSTATPVSPADMWQSMTNAWYNLFGSNPTSAQLMVLMAQWGLETGNGASMIQYNVGNFKSTAGDGLDYTTFRTREVINGEDVYLDQNFKAYPDLDSGVAAYLASLAPPSGRFSSAWPYVLSGDLDGFAQALKNAGYYTASEESYAAGLHARASQFEALDLPDPSVDVTTTPGFALVIGAATAGLYYYAWQEGLVPSPMTLLRTAESLVRGVFA
jgi:hypothetical protein